MVGVCCGVRTTVVSCLLCYFVKHHEELEKTPHSVIDSNNIMRFLYGD